MRNHPFNYQKVKRIVSSWPIDSSSLSSGFRLSFLAFLPSMASSPRFGNTASVASSLCSFVVLLSCCSSSFLSSSFVTNGFSADFDSDCACCCCCCSFSICSNFWRTMLECPVTCSDILRRCAEAGHCWFEKDTLRWLNEWLSVASKLPRVR